MKRMTAILLTVLMLLTGLCACDGGGKDPASTGSVTDPETAPETDAPFDPSSVKYDGYKTPCVVETYFTDEVIVADAVVTDKLYKADPTGQKDCSDVLNKAIKTVSGKGGGTVFLPAGTYRIEKPIEVLPFVTVIGDHSAKDDGSEGTVILACVPSSEEELPALFQVGGSAGVVGLTVYYPDQSIDDVKPYPFTFAIPGTEKSGKPEYYMLSTIRDCTVLNGYRGIWAGSVNEQMNIYNVRGTFLDRALELYDSADASSISYINASPDYWANCALGSAPRAKIADYTGLKSEAFVLGDIEWGSFTELVCEDYSVGIHIVKGPRAKFSGMFYCPVVENAAIGMIVDDIDERSGYGIGVTGGMLDAYEQGVVNNTKGKVQFTDTVISAENSGSVVINRDAPSEYPVYKREAPQPSKDITVLKGIDTASAYDCSERLQSALDKMGSTGGILYIPAGFYLLEKPVTVPANVELRGAGTAPVRDQMSVSAGTVFFSHVDLKAGESALTLGEGAGVRYIDFVQATGSNLTEYQKNGNKFDDTAFFLSMKGKNCYAIGCAFSGMKNAIEIVKGNGYYISNLSLNAYQTGIRVDSSDHGYIGYVLTNTTVGFRNGFWKLANNNKIFSKGQDKSFEASLKDNDPYNTVNMMMDNFTEVLYEYSDDCFCENVFSYGALHTISAVSSTVTGINIGKDCNWLYKVTTPMITVSDGSEVALYNMTRFNGTSYDVDDISSLDIWTRVTINENENNVSVSN